MKKLTIALGLFALAGVAQAQTIVLDNFNSPGASGSITVGSSWVGQVTVNPTTITVGGSAKDENAWSVPNTVINATGMNFIAITASVDAGNLAPNIVVGFSDGALDHDVFSVNTSLFTSSLSTVYIPVAWTSVDPTDVEEWDIGGGTNGITTFHVTFDNLAFSATGPIPEPATYAAILGATALGFVAYRRRRQLAA